MGTALDRLAVRLARVPVAAHKRVRKGKVQDVEAHLRKVEVGPGFLGDDQPAKYTPIGAKQLRTSKVKPPSKKPGSSRDNPIVTGDVNEAAKLLGEGKYVELTSKNEVSTLVRELKKIGDDAVSKGKKAPNYNLCNITVENTNLFCVESKGIPRIDMPQLGGVPTPGSKADKFPKNKAGEVDLSAEFAKFLTTHDVTGDGVPEVVDDEHALASHLKATQDELGGTQVADIVSAMEEHGIDPDRAWLWVSKDNYIIDGHHRWAAQVTYGLGKKEDVEVPVHKVDMDIISILQVAEGWTQMMGIPPKKLNAPPVVLARLWELRDSLSTV
jgi:hypothetical protein